MIETPITKMLGIQHPIVCGGMQHVGKAELAAAVSNAGALGMITSLTQPTPDALRAEIAKCRSLTGNPFAVNLTILPAITPPPYAEFAQAIIDSGVKIVETAGNNPEKFIKMFKQAGIIVIHKCVAIRHALKAEKMGADIISIDGQDCAGHTGEDDVGNIILLPKAARVLKVPFLASGGFADGRGLAAALAFGASGINMGTRFLCTVEAPIHENIKKTMVASSELSTALIFRKFHNTARVFKNKIAKEIVAVEAKPNAVFEDIKDLASGARGKQVFENGDPEFGLWTAGQVMGLIDDIPTCAALVSRVAAEAEEIISARLSRLVVGPRRAPLESKL